MKEAPADFLINRLATSIVDESLPLKEVERELRGKVADVAVRQRGLKKRELASRCGVTEKSVENYLKESRTNPKSPDREIVRILQDRALTLEEVHEAAFPLLRRERNFTLDDVKRIIAKLVRTGEVKEHSGRRYRAVKKPAIRCPRTPEAFRGLVDQKARDMDYIILKQKQIAEEDLEPQKLERYSRVVGDTNLIRIDFTVDVAADDLPEFYEKLSKQIAKLTMRYEKKNGKSRVRLLLGMRTVSAVLLACLLTLVPQTGSRGQEDPEQGDSWELDDPVAAPEDPHRDRNDSWELDNREDKAIQGAERFGAGEPHSPREGFLNLFVRGDVNSDTVVGVSDAVKALRYLFLREAIDCEDAADSDDNGLLDVNDPIQILEYLFVDGSVGAGTLDAGPVVDQTEDVLGCESGIEVPGLEIPPQEIEEEVEVEEGANAD